MQRTLSRYFVMALAAVVIGASITIQGTLAYLNGLANYHAELNFCKIHNCPALPNFTGTQDFVLIGLGLLILFLGIALLTSDLAQLPNLKARNCWRICRRLDKTLDLSLRQGTF